MINYFIKKLLRKEVILYNKHRQTLPILANDWNRQHYYFINLMNLIKWIPFKTNNKNKFKIIYCLLWIIRPKYIIDINWISRIQLTYYLFCLKNNETKFIVIQHGIYVGGMVTDIAHRYTKCQIFLCWSEYFVQIFQNYNAGKSTKMITFGNTVFNDFKRSKMVYSKEKNGKVLIAPSGVKEKRYEAVQSMAKKLLHVGFQVFFKGHNFQESKYAIIENFTKVESPILKILNSREFDFIISDHSTVLLDAIYFKNPVLLFSMPGELHEYSENIYSSLLKNQYFLYEGLNTMSDWYDAIDIQNQEKLLNLMVATENSNNSLQIIN